MIVFKPLKELSILSTVLLGSFTLSVFAEQEQQIKHETDSALQTMMDLGAKVFEEEYARQNRAADLLLKKYEAGEITLEDYYRLEAERRQLEYQQEVAEIEGAMESISSFYDLEDGPMAGLVKKASSLETRRERQINELNFKIDRILENVTEENVWQTKLKLLNISWVPLGDTQIDREMSTYFHTKIETIIAEMVE